MATREGYRWFRGAWQPSAAQRRVLDELAAGHTNAEIAVRLGLSVETVKWHVAQMLSETGSADREALARWWRAGRAERRPMLWPLAGLVARLAATAAALGVGALLLFAGIGGARRLVDHVELRPRLVSVARPPDPLPTPELLPSPPPAPAPTPAPTPAGTQGATPRSQVVPPPGTQAFAVAPGFAYQLTYTGPPQAVAFFLAPLQGKAFDVRIITPDGLTIMYQPGDPYQLTYGSTITFQVAEPGTLFIPLEP